MFARRPNSVPLVLVRLGFLFRTSDRMDTLTDDLRLTEEEEVDEMSNGVDDEALNRAEDDDGMGMDVVPATESGHVPRWAFAPLSSPFDSINASMIAQCRQPLVANCLKSGLP